MTPITNPSQEPLPMPTQTSSDKLQTRQQMLENELREIRQREEAARPLAGNMVEQVRSIIAEWEQQRENWNMRPDDRRAFIERQAALLAQRAEEAERERELLRAEIARCPKCQKVKP